MGAKGVIEKKLETGIPDCVIIKFSQREYLELRVTVRKPKYKQIHRCLHTSEWPEAMTQFGAVYADVIREPDIYSHKNVVFIKKLIDQFIELQSQRVSREEIAEGTYNSKERTIYKGLLPFCIHHNLEKISDLARNSFLDYAVWRKDNFGYQASTINVEIVHIKEFLFWIQKSKGHCPGFDWVIPPLRKTKNSGPKPNAAYSDDHIEDMMSYLESQCKNDNHSPYKRWSYQLFTQFFILQMECGARTAEFTHVQWKHVKIKNWDPSNPDSLNQIVNDVHIPISKTGPRDIVFESSALVILKKMYESKGRVLNQNDYVFSNLMTRQRQGPQLFNKIFKLMHEELGYGPEYTLYSTRSVYISDRILQNTPISLIAQNVGNSSRIIEERYMDIILRLNTGPLTQRILHPDSPSEWISPV